MSVIEMLKAILLGIVEGITEWLPVSSTGHMILAEEWFPLDVTPEFNEMFLVVIQLGAILAVCMLYFEKLNPFYGRKSPRQKNETFKLWFQVIAGCIPAGILGVLLNDWFDEHFYNSVVVAVALIAYGIIFILLEYYNKKREFRIRSFSQMSYGTALGIGLFQCLALIPGTSRSGATILGAMLLGVSRATAAEFSFFLSAPVMFGASLIKVIKFVRSGVGITGSELAVLITGSVTAFLVSVAAIRFLLSYVRRHNFSLFGYYRIFLGVAVLIYFAL